jgi:hypothetical protein
MKISHLATRGIAGVPDLDCDLVSSTSGRPHDLVIVSGPAASGKTRLCELVLAVLETVGPYQGIVRAADWMADPARGARVEMGFWLTEDEAKAAPVPANPRATVHFSSQGIRFEIDRALGRLLARYDHDPSHGKREYFPETRQRAWGARSDGTRALEQGLLRCSKDPQKYSAIPRFLAELGETAGDPRRQTFADALARLSPTVRYAPVKTADGGAYFSSRESAGVRYDELSDSETDAVLIAATHTMIGLCHSIVLLDRAELYVPAARVVPWVHGLTTLGADNQWFVSTADVGLAASVERPQRISLGELS